MKKLKLKSKILLLVLIMLAFYLKKNDFVKLNISKTSIEDTNNKKETFEEVKNKENLNNSEYTIVLNNLNQEYKNEKIKIPNYNGKDYVEINNNVPFFDDDYENSSENLNESYMPLDDLVAKGVLMEAQSLESDDIKYCVFVYNIQPDITIDYRDGSAKLN